MVLGPILALALLGADAQASVCAPRASGLIVTIRGVQVDVNRHGAMVASGQNRPTHPPESDTATAPAVRDLPNVETGAVWTLVTPEGRRPLRLPSALQGSGTGASVLARTAAGVWMRTAEGIAWVDARSATVRSMRLGGAGAEAWVLSAEPELELILGRRVLRCAPSGGCRELPRWPASIGERVKVGSGWLIQGGDPRPGVYRLHVGEMPVELVGGNVERVCADGTDMGWVAMRTAEGIRVVALSMNSTEIHVYDPDEILSYALIRAPKLPDAAVVVEVLQRAVEAKWPSAEALTLRAQREATTALREVSAASAPALSPLRGAALLWKMARDPNVNVRRAAFQAVRTKCERGDHPACTGLLSAFASDQEPSIGWTARDLLISEEPERALWEASKEYKLDVLSALSARVAHREDPSALRALELLANDSEPEVRLRAHTVLNLSEP